MKILIIDDERPILETLKMFFEESGHEVFTSEDGESGLNAFLSEHPDLVILDIRLPDMGGLDVLRNIRGHDRRTMVIVTTASYEMEEIISKMNFGPLKYISKPIDLEELENSIEVIGKGFRQGSREKVVSAK